MNRTINISLPAKLADEADKVAKKMATTRSEMIRISLREYVERAKLLEATFKMGEAKAGELGLKTEEDVMAFLES
jgi:metal-responsive CopG/Arc/MetJ family transcriptional regulator